MYAPGRLETIHILRQQMTGWVGLENGQFCWLSVLYLCWFNTSSMGGSEKVQNFADVVYGWSTFTAYDLLWILNISAARVVKFIMPSTAMVEYMGNLGITLCWCSQLRYAGTKFYKPNTRLHYTGVRANDGKTKFPPSTLLYQWKESRPVNFNLIGWKMCRWSNFRLTGIRLYVLWKELSSLIM